ncbi:uncharacterized protein At2g29880-like [Prunus dulcis]|uniref:uncharacterized protein At2g29880-like n=1 Tax=Prunus dulcis TaxID=3755 RepID=UPI001482E33B|nr:uncharacterized protein At2g29880-like [Prunus dulcis]
MNLGPWTMDNTNELLHLLVDAINIGLCDANGSLSKQNVERVVRHLNAKIRFPKNNHCLSRMKWFKKQYNKMSMLMCNISGFEWYLIAKTFIASDEVWKDYLKSHPSYSILWEKSVVDYEDLKIIVGGGIAPGNGSIALWP